MSLLPEFAAALLGVLVESAPLVVLGFVIAGLLHEFVPTSALKKRVGGSSLLPVLRVVGVGALLPVCSCSTIPLGIGLRRSGASVGTALAFMTSSPAASPVSLVLGWAVLGPALVGWYAALAVGGALLIGVTGNWLLADREGPVSEPAACGCGCGAPADSGSRLWRALRWCFGELGVEVSQSLVVGLGVASLVLVALPTGLVEQWLGRPSWVALLAAVALSLPANTCSVPSIVIAGSLIARGVDPGVAVVFLIAGPATNLGELNAIRAAMGLRATAYYAGMLIAIALAAGAATSLLPLPAGANLAAHAGHEHTHALDAAVLGGGAASVTLSGLPLWRLPFAGLVVALACSSLVRAVRKRCAASAKSPESLPTVFSITSR